MDPSGIIAEAIGRERERAGLSLSALAKKASLAKSTLSQLEAGKGNPSIETLWAIATALEVPFSFLFENAPPQSRLIRAGDGEALSSEVSDYTAFLLSACPPNARRDLYRTTLRAGSVREADPHPKGTIEHAWVGSGRVRIGPRGAQEDLGANDYYAYPGDVPHTYEALSNTAVVLLVMESPR
ncbi:DNA-binding protein [Acuticoccus sediminis]|uniref:DNA-binding protein n=1 Tax=Acuticoccus sediminis TaxID=2184697 RepID=A0A8B2P0I8_9HYPH|nr:XRE family transcriptional regulator [Acuticoccus sediminis]RAI02310.1 DNA-binding protein [Acuticoccus sediminis]